MCSLRELFLIIHLKCFIILVIMYTISIGCVEISSSLT
uniref:Uncharacterized protein n=1 Tax=virus sp. ctx9V1 TaxID=2828001 RepID=A0A8S5RDK7_9VIRU|nr:MAG TPA: hypothetical protein [virus sp. ctx9V1]